MRKIIIFLAAILSFQLGAKEAFAIPSQMLWEKSPILGKYDILNKNILSLDGKTTGLNLDSKLLSNPEKGITLLAVVKFLNTPQMTTQDRQHHAIFCRAHQFIMGLDFDRFYVNFHNGKKWFSPLLVNVRIRDNQFHSFALTVKRHKVESQGDDSIMVKMYFDGKLVLEKNIPNASINDSKGQIDIGYSSSFGKVWHLGGQIRDVRAYNKVLSVYDIEDYTLSFKEIKTKLQRSKRLSKADTILIEKLPKKGASHLLAAVSAIKNVSLRTNKFNWQKLAKVLETKKLSLKELPQYGFYQYKLKSGILTVVANNQYADIVSLYDPINKREMLCSDNPFFRLKIKNEIISPIETTSTSKLTLLKDGKFQIKWNFPKADATLTFECKNNRINYFIKANPNKNITLDNVEFPALELRNLSSEAALFAPVMSGVEHPFCVKNNVSYELQYPRGIASMQYGAFYDKNGGLFWSPADPIARPKHLNFIAGANRVKISYQWFPQIKAPFDPKCPIQLELFKGNWYDAAIIYKEMLNRIDALYSIKEPLPRKDSPQWLKNNTLWFLHGGSKLDSMAIYKKIKEYLALPFAVHLYRWNSKTFDRDYPHHRALPSFLNLLEECHSMGIKVTPYINGRLWETKDRREDDYLYSKVGKANCVLQKNGTIASSVFNKANFNIICPYTNIYEEMMKKSCFMLEQMGVDGIYVDQIGAASHIVCHATNHGHPVSDDTAWFLKGQHKVFSQIRSEMKTRTPDIILTTEDNAETCIRNFDALLCWRWMYKCQVPAFSAVYNGKTQLIGLTYDFKRDAEASFAKVAWQVIGGGQIGWFTKDYFCAPEKHNFRVWVKQLMRLRLALLPFFNEGKMTKPVEFNTPIKEKILFWGGHGTLRVNTPELYTTSWKFNNVEAIIITNNTNKNIQNSFVLNQNTSGKLYYFDSNGLTSEKSYNKIINHKVNLKANSFQVLLIVPNNTNAKNLITSIKNQFNIISNIPFEHDPFQKEQKQLAFYNKLSWITTVNTNKLECIFFPGAMYPTNFRYLDGTILPSVEFNDSIVINNVTYYLNCDRWAEKKIIQNSKDKFVIELNGTFCTSAREYAAPNVKATYRYTFTKDSPEVKINAKVILPENTIAKIELLNLQCNSKSNLTWVLEKQVANKNIITRNGKLILK